MRINENFTKKMHYSGLGSLNLTKNLQEGAGSPTECDIGKYNNKEKMANETDCLECLPGYYCNVTGKCRD